LSPCRLFSSNYNLVTFYKDAKTSYGKLNMTEIRSFKDMPLGEELLRAVDEQGYSEPTPIQAQSIPSLLDGRDLLGCAQTGTGKTAAFALPILRLLGDPNKSQRGIRSLILTPTRELAAQIDESFKDYGKYLPLKSTVIFGGVSQHPQVKAVEGGVDILVATPGRLLDLMNQGIVHLSDLEIFVLDEADRMLDMGFIHDVRRVIAELPKRRQSLFFSATMPPVVAELASSLLYKPVKVEVVPQATPIEKIEQSVFFVDQRDKRRLLELLLDDEEVTRALVFTRTKHGASRVAQILQRQKVAADSIHGDKAQNARTRALAGFKSGKVRVLVATDIAARGIDVEGISHVFNYDLPNVPETYVHRIGRTARAGADGVAFSFCSGLDLADLKAIEKLIGFDVPYGYEEKYHSEEAEKGLVDGVPAAEVKKQREQERQQKIRDYKEAKNKKQAARGGSAQRNSSHSNFSNSNRSGSAQGRSGNRDKFSGRRGGR
jgi:ATP-dependent RNA helicase RhlE